MTRLIATEAVVCAAEYGRILTASLEVPVVVTWLTVNDFRSCPRPSEASGLALSIA
jgi:hypothetical protein